MISLARSSIGYLILILYVLVVAPPAMLYAVMRARPEVLFKAGRLAVRLGFLLAGIRYSVFGREKVRPGDNYVFISNHCSNLDPMVLLMAIPRDVRIIAKKELLKIPLLGRAMLIGNFVFVDRKKPEDAQAGVDRAAEIVRKGYSFLIFPEGTRSATGQLGSFKKGAFVLAIKGGVDIVPVTVQGSYQSMPKRAFTAHPGRVRVTFHDPIATAGLEYDDRERLLKEARQKMLDALSAGS